MKIKEADNLAIILGTMTQIKGVVAYKVARNLRMITEELKEYNEIKNELFKKYGEVKGENVIIEKTSNNYNLFLEEIKPYEEQDVNFDFKKITEEELENGDLTVEQIIILSEYFSE